MIPRRNISLITNSLVTDNKRRLPEAVIERDYVLAWFLSGLSNHPLREKPAFKGGTALRRCWFDGYRFSEDMDFTLIEPLAIENVMTGFGDIHNAVRAASGVHIQFDQKDSPLTFKHSPAKDNMKKDASSLSELRPTMTRFAGNGATLIPAYGAVAEQISL